MIATSSIEFIKNLAQYNYNNQYYDFHNDYNCEKISYSNGILLILFKKLTNDDVLSLKFSDVTIKLFDFFNEFLTLDTLYRGRVESNGELIEISEDGKSYFYLEFYEGQRIEFWARWLVLEHQTK
jgi:hypothetical protein